MRRHFPHFMRVLTYRDSHRMTHYFRGTHRVPPLLFHPSSSSSSSFSLAHSHSYTTTSPSSAITSSDPSQCWKCSREWSEQENGLKFFCTCNQRIVLPPSTSHTFFDVMDCPVSYTLDIETLKERFKELQRQLHPDRFSTASSEEQEYSAGQSALINRAYSTLLQHYSRGLYLLELKGLTIDEKDTLNDSLEFLEEMWAVRESIDKAVASGDNATLLKLCSINNENLEHISDEVAAAFESGEYGEAKEGLERMKYFVNIEETLKDKLDPPE